MGRRRCCCFSPGCPIFEDDFNRPNSTNIGSGWEEVYKDSTLVDETLRIPAAGMVIGTKQHPWGSRDLGQTGNVYALAKNLQPGKKFQIIINAWEHPTSGWLFLYGLLECGEGGEATITVSGGHSIGGLSYEAGQDTGMWLCRSEHGLYFEVGLSSNFVWGCHEDNGGRKAGLGNIGTGNTEFDDYYFGELSWTNPICPRCECECQKDTQYHCISKTLLFTFEASGDCSCLDGASMNLEWDEERPGDWVWNGEDDLPDWQCPEGFPPRTYEFDLYCPYDPEKWKLVLLQGEIDCEEESPPYVGWISDESHPYQYPSSYTCDPFVLTFGPFHCDWSGCEDGCECVHWIIITEAP